MSRHTGRLIGAADWLRASHISRWGIVRTATTQSVAEHMWRVWSLVHQWGPLAGLTEQQQHLAEQWALTHDLAEIRTGDAPTPHKTPEVKTWLSQVEAEICPEAAAIEHQTTGTIVADFCKHCDTAEAILYLRVNGLGKHSQDVCRLLEEQMLSRLERSKIEPAAQRQLIAVFTSTYHLT